MSIEAMKQALEALKMCRGLIRNNIAEGVAISSPNPFFSADVDNAITTLRTAIAEAEKQSAEERSSVERGEPVAVVSGYYGGQCVVLPTNPARLFNSGTAFYTTPPAAPVQEPPPECQTEAEKRAYAFGWWKALEANRAAQRQLVGLTDDDWQHIADKTGQIIWSGIKQAVDAKLREKNGA